MPSTGRIVTIYQDSDLIPTLTVAENVVPQPGARPRTASLHPGRQLAADARTAGSSSAWTSIPGRDRARPARTIVQKMVQIVKAVSKDARVLLMDEPTSSLTASEVDLLLPFVRALAARGVGVVFISHYLSEVFRVCDSITILREGAVVRTVARAETRPRRGDPRHDRPHDPGGGGRAAGAAGRPGGVRRAGLSVRRRLIDVSLTSTRGRSWASRGLIGSGTTELAKAMFRSEDVAVRKRASTAWTGSRSSLSGTGAAVRQAIGLRAERPQDRGAVRRFSVTDNICMAGVDRYARPPRPPGPAAHGRTPGRSTSRPSPSRPRDDTPVENLSGGNQQKVLLAKWLATEPRVLILDEPTIGIDVGTKYEIRRLIRGDRRPRGRGDPHHLRDRGAGEALHRVLVLFRGGSSGVGGRRDQKESI